jgi:hypothetical protein
MDEKIVVSTSAADGNVADAVRIDVNPVVSRAAEDFDPARAIVGKRLRSAVECNLRTIRAGVDAHHIVAIGAKDLKDITGQQPPRFEGFDSDPSSMATGVKGRKERYCFHSRPR